MGSSSLTRDQSQAPCIGGPESQPLDHQGSPCCLSYVALNLKEKKNAQAVFEAPEGKPVWATRTF